MSRPILLVDNLDSFSFNLVETFERLGCAVQVVRNAIGAGEAFATAEATDATIVLSPGPGGPRDAGCCLELIALAKGRRPLLGVCLGHQAIVEEAGGVVARAPEPVHGKSGLATHNGQGAFAGLPNPLKIGRYHSLAALEVPERLQVDARCGEVIMAVSDRTALQVGLQFHPESILTPDGDRLLRNLLTRGDWRGGVAPSAANG
ncbi:aminodeoxychorismate/anthranilate synthase component II [uncultured Sphingomonas sp.]|uniref:anthranilate synthase component II n=1 Tax=uncultured Sphingomonas sp. TaxID=158754 RepID=UPI0025D0498D|nr:aminodeoxychorismate/anthranilate synthase component II [uncultured Sphingomonas sp.]